ncbi:hypothetical protein [Marinicrinis lubricantis]|uniref:Uncharacterized protein n=1 Tax=Marinicrinis lubricantis TaxID=2086470 RepID=A0ABW1IH63_9BACL
MASNTPNLELLKKDPNMDGNDTFDIKTMLNDNWDKIDEEIGRVRAQMDQDNVQTATLQRGLNVLNTDRVSGVNISEIKGRTLINFDKNGKLDELSDLLKLDYPSNFTTELSDGGVKVTVTAATSYITFRTPVMANIYSVYGEGTYLFAVDIKKPNNRRFSIQEHGNDFTAIGSTTANLTEYTTVFAPVGISSTNNQSMRFGFDGGLDVGDYVVLKDARIYKLTAEEVDWINSGRTAEEVSKEYPYVHGMQSLMNPYVIAKGKNLVPPFTRWAITTTASRAEVISPYELELVAQSDGAAYVTESPKLSVMVGANYVYSAEHNGRLVVLFYDSSGVLLSSATSLDQYMAFTVPVGTAHIKTRVDNGNIAGEYRFKNTMLNLGSEPLPFEPYEEQYAYIQETIREGERLYEDNGKLMKWTTKGYKVLDGSLDWAFSATFNGYKRVSAFIGGGITNTDLVTKYNGKPLESSFGTVNFTGGDQSRLSTDNAICISVSNADSGWGDNYTPTVDEIKAYFMGWKMTAKGASFTDPYNGTGTKAWVELLNVMDAPNAKYTETLPTTLATNYTPYQLQYNLATPYAKEVDVVGDISLIEGTNALEFGEGVVIEMAKLYKSSTGYDWNPALAGYEPKYRPLRILAILKNGQLDTGSWTINSWTLTSPPAYKDDAWAKLAFDKYDANAVYHVVYEAREKYKLTTKAETVQIEYNASQKSVIDQAVMDIADHKTETDLKIKAIRGGGRFDGRISAPQVDVSGNSVEGIRVFRDKELLPDGTNVGDGISLSWYNDIARLRLFGSVPSASENEFQIQGIGNIVRFAVDQYGNAKAGGKDLDAIESTGTNANGGYIRYRNGLQLCWGSTSIGNIAVNAWNNVVVTLPASYDGPRYSALLSFQAFGAAGANVWQKIAAEAYQSSSFRVVLAQSSASSLSQGIAWFTIGFWK